MHVGIFSFIYLVTTYSSNEKGSIYFTFTEYTITNEGTTLDRKFGVVVKEGPLLGRAIWRKKNGKPSSREKVATSKDMDIFSFIYLMTTITCPNFVK